MRKETELMMKAMMEFGKIIFNKYKVDILKQHQLLLYQIESLD
jgi:hypothetical protein